MTAARTKSVVDPSTENRMSGLYLLLAVIVFCAGAGAIWFGVKTHTITRTHVVKVEKSWGKPDDSAPANQVIVAELAARLGLTKCDLYAAKRTVVCS